MAWPMLFGVERFKNYLAQQAGAASNTRMIQGTNIHDWSEQTLRERDSTIPCPGHPIAARVG